MRVGRLASAGLIPFGGIIVPPDPPPSTGNFADDLALGLLPDGEGVQWPIPPGIIHQYTGLEPDITYSEAVFGPSYPTVPAAHLALTYDATAGFGPRLPQAAMTPTPSFTITNAHDGQVFQGLLITGTTLKSTATNANVTFRDCIIDQTAQSGGADQSCWENKAQNAGKIRFEYSEFRGSTGAQQCLWRPRDGDEAYRCYFHHPAVDCIKGGRSETQINQGWGRGGMEQCVFIGDAFIANHVDFHQLGEARAGALVFRQNFIWMPGLNTSWNRLQTGTSGIQPHSAFYWSTDTGAADNKAFVGENCLADRNLVVGGVAAAQLDAGGTSSRIGCFYFRKNVFARPNGGGFNGSPIAANGKDSGNRQQHHFYGAAVQGTSPGTTLWGSGYARYENIAWWRNYDLDGNPAVINHQGANIPLEAGGRFHFFTKTRLSQVFRDWLFADALITPANDPAGGVTSLYRQN